MKDGVYHQKRIHYTVDVEEVRELISRDDDTQVILQVKLAQSKDGMSREAFDEMLDKLTNKLSDVRIHNSPDGLTVTGKL